MTKNKTNELALLVTISFLTHAQCPIWASQNDPAHYDVTRLTVPAGYTNCQPIAVNNNGTIIGNVTSTDGTSARESFIYAHGQITILKDSWLFALNNSDQILGRASTASDASTLTFTITGTPVQQPNCPEMWPKAITDSGIIAGDSTGKQAGLSNAVLPFIYQNGVVHWFSLPDGYVGGEVHAVDNRGHTAYGNVWSAIGMPGRAVCWSKGKVDFVPIPTLPMYSNKAATGIIGVSKSGEILCTLSYNDPSRQTVTSGYLVLDNTPILVSSLSGAAGTTNLVPTGISADSSIIGADTGGAVLIQQNSVTDLNSLVDPASGWKLTYASAISDNGSIVGTGTLNGVAEAFLLTPVTK